MNCHACHNGNTLHIRMSLKLFFAEITIALLEVTFTGQVMDCKSLLKLTLQLYCWAFHFILLHNSHLCDFTASFRFYLKQLEDKVCCNFIFVSYNQSI